jgi:hypothetical protein
MIKCGGSLRDVQELAGHASLATMQRYIAGDAEAKRRVIALRARPLHSPTSALRPFASAPFLVVAIVRGSGKFKLRSTAGQAPIL